MKYFVQTVGEAEEDIREDAYNELVWEERMDEQEKEDSYDDSNY